MKEPIPALACESCGKLHKLESKYLEVTATVREHAFWPNKTKEGEEVKAEDAIVCNNKCLADLLSIRGH